MAYATKADVSEYTGVLEADLPADTDRLLARASELLDQATLRRIDPENADHAAAARLAACAQVEYWLEVGEEQAVSGPVQGLQLGSLQVQYGAGDNRVTPLELAPRARRHLLLAGLLSRGVEVW